MDMDTYMLGKWQPTTPMKISKKPGGLAFLQYGRHVKIAIVMT